jgi:2-keto-4-pentenoate hydratase
MTASVQDIAAIVVRRHRARERFASLRELIGSDISRAYDVQDQVNQELAGSATDNHNAAGYKIGLTTPRMQAMCGVDQPIAGTIYAGRLHASQASIAMAPHLRLSVESEIAVQVGQALPVFGELNPTSALACLSQVCAAFEMIDDSDADYKMLDAVSLIADNSWNAGLVLGPPTPAKNFSTLKNRAGVLYRDGEVLDQGNSSDVMGDPLQVIVWLARHLAARGHALQPGQWITTGSIVTTKFVKSGERYRFEVKGLAAVEVGVT